MSSKRDPNIGRRCRCTKNRDRLFTDIDEENDYDGDSDSESAEEYDDAASTGETSTDCFETSSAVETGALVYLRLKPVEIPSSAYSISAEGNVLITSPFLESCSSSRNKNSMVKRYSFSEIFDSDVNQREVYEKCIGEKILAEESFNVLTYGTSGSGKTFTLLGDDDRPGIIPRALENIFTLYQYNIHPNPLVKLVNARTTFLDDYLVEKEILLQRQILNNCKNLETNYFQLQQSICYDHNFKPKHFDDVSVFIWVTFVEIYNELVYDLLAPIKSRVSSVSAAGVNRKNLRIVCNDGNVFVKGVTSIYIKSSLEALKLMRSGLQRLTYASTSINANSSRSHCVFLIDVLKYYRNGAYTATSYKFCDLAGSERIYKTGNMGSRLKEAQRINTSLMVLGRCLDAANNIASSHSTTSAFGKKERIPFRESKLTTILQAALQGREKLTMIVNLTPTEKFYEENLNVLNFASIASNIIFKARAAKQNKSRFSVFGTTTDNGYIQHLLDIITKLKADFGKLTRKIEQQKHQINNLEEIIDENYHLKEEIERLTLEHAKELFGQEQDIRNLLVDSFKVTLDEHKKQFEHHIQREIKNQKRIYDSRIEFLKRRHQEELNDLKEELEAGGDNNFVENYNENIITEVNIEIKENKNVVLENEKNEDKENI